MWIYSKGFNDKSTFAISKYLKIGLKIIFFSSNLLSREHFLRFYLLHVPIRCPMGLIIKDSYKDSYPHYLMKKILLQWDNLNLLIGPELSNILNAVISYNNHFYFLKVLKLSSIWQLVKAISSLLWCHLKALVLLPKFCLISKDHTFSNTTVCAISVLSVQQYYSDFHTFLYLECAYASIPLLRCQSRRIACTQITKCT